MNAQPTNGCSARRSFLKTMALGATAIPVLGAAKFAFAAPQQNDMMGQHFQEVMQHENEHVKFIAKALGKNARPKPTFKGLEQSSVADFIQIANALENTGVGAYFGAAPHISNPQYLVNAVSIAMVEARHAGWLNGLAGKPIGENAKKVDWAFEQPLTIAEVVKAAGPFLEGLNGGPELTFSTEKSEANDYAIFNFALALEYLEAEFYNVNVPKLFGSGATTTHNAAQ